tara:strand:+ start:21 stop:707 length:687 start_codon:yes stop_codon:yes gene_type:complete
MRSGKFAKGKKSYAISDIGGHRVPYTKLKTQWDGLRVDAEEYSPKHPQLDPPRQIVDAVALRNSRSDNAPENINFFVGFNYDPFLDRLNRPRIGIGGLGALGTFTIRLDHSQDVTGVAGTGGVGDETLLASIAETGVAGTGGVGVEIPVVEVTGVSATGGAGSVGIEALSVSITETGVAGTGGVGVVATGNLAIETGVGGTGAVGDESITITELGWSGGDWGEGAWGQ